ncbi:MAG: class I mannose-6-phosphate isomerase [Erysipelotrichaceae bacterium]|nr:class I mannose-6-phosphate isomerase [Erysipelotrichaceae bacterium]
MNYINFASKYDKYPETVIPGFDDQAFNGWKDIVKVISEELEHRNVLTVDCYPGVHDQELLSNFEKCRNFDLIIRMDDIFFESEKITEMMKPFLTDDRVRGKYYYGIITDFMDSSKLETARKKVRETVSENKKVLVYGFGAYLVTEKGLLVYADMTRWEIQLRYRKGESNYKANNPDEDSLKKIKRGYFIEWRIADRHKEKLLDRIDYYLDSEAEDDPNMVCGEGLRTALKSLVNRPFRMVPYFDPGVWGGQWMKEVCHLDPSRKNYAWSFDGVPEENSLFFRFGRVRVASPAMNLTKYRPVEFLGKKTFSRFGAEFPIRFDFLDTMNGQNLSLQVHPTTEYIHEKFGMAYTQDESYYILDCQGDGGVFLGLKEGIDPKEMIAELKEAQTGKIRFDDSKYINFFKAKKFDHYLIPAGTIHCSSSDCMVLEISATPYNFTFKLWDWDRLGLDGLPRPIHIEDGEQVIQFNRTTEWVKDNLVNRFEKLTENADYTETRTGLHELEFIESRVYDITTAVTFRSNGEFCMCNLVDGQEAVIESPDGLFEPYEVHYAETFIIPANAGDAVIRTVDGKPVKIIKANVRY